MGNPKMNNVQEEFSMGGPRSKRIWDSEEFKAFMTRRGFDKIYLDSADFAEFMKADNEDNG
jgi:hypothetical protein